MRRRSYITAGAVICAFVLPLATVPAAASMFEDELPDGQLIALEDGPLDDQQLLDALTLPPITSEQNQWLAKLEASFGKDDDFISLEISEDRKAITLTWFGELDDQLRELFVSPPAKTELTVRPSSYRGIDLRSALANAMAAKLDGVEVVSGGVAIDGSGVELDVYAPGHDEETAADLVLGALRTSVPVTVNLVEGEAVPYYGRWDDPYHLGGGFIVNATAGNGCSSGFAVCVTAHRKG